MRYALQVPQQWCVPSYLPLTSSLTGARQGATAEVGLSTEFHVSTEVSTLAVTLFVIGLGIGPMLTGPLAEVVGQKRLYLASFFLLWCFTWPVAFARSLGELFQFLRGRMMSDEGEAVHLVFRFLQGVCGSAFLGIGGATITSLFTGQTVAMYEVLLFFLKKNADEIWIQTDGCIYDLDVHRACLNARLQRVCYQPKVADRTHWC